MLKSYHIILYAILFTSVQACCGDDGGNSGGNYYNYANGIALLDTSDKIIQIRFANSQKVLDVNSKKAALLLSASNPHTIMFIQTKNTWDTLVFESIKTLEYLKDCNEMRVNIENLNIKYSSFDTAYIVHYYYQDTSNYRNSLTGDSIYLKLK